MENFTKAVSEVQNRIERVHVDIEEMVDMLISTPYITGYFAGENKYNSEEFMDYLQNKLDDAVVEKDTIYSIMLCNYDKQIILSKYGGLDVFSKIVQEYRLFNKYVSQPFYTASYKQEDSGNIVYGYVFPVNTQKKEFFYNNNYGICIILCRVDVIKDIIDAVISDSNHEYLLIDNDDVIVSSNSDYIGKPVQPWIKKIYETSADNYRRDIFDYDGKSYLFKAYNIKGDTWKLFCMASMTGIEKQGLVFWKRALFTLISVAILFGIVVFSVISNITKPITYIVKSLEKIGKSDDTERIRVIGNNEIEEIAIYINKMLDRMKVLHENAINSQNEMFSAKLNEKQAQIYTLQSQIKPHFLYNTLGCIKSNAIKNEMNKVDEIVDSLIKIFRYSIKGKEIVTLNDEFNCINIYFHIFEIRYEKRISMTFEVDENILDKKIPRMILQPVIENAISHGIENKMTGGTIHVKGFIDTDVNIKIVIHDNGMGIPRKELLKLNERLRNCKNEIIIPADANTSIGLVNVNSRIKFYFGQEYGIQLESNPETGTSAIIRIPFVS